ncbi:MAG: hypothetical protein ACP5OF_01440 [bacterium]
MKQTDKSNKIDTLQDGEKPLLKSRIGEPKIRMYEAYQWIKTKKKKSSKN